MTKAKTPFARMDLPHDLTVFGLDAATNTGLARANLANVYGRPGTFIERGARDPDTSAYSVRMDYCTATRGEELATARDWMMNTASRLVLVVEQAFVGKNPTHAAKVISARARWIMAFEHYAAKTCRKLDVVEVTPTTWQSGWLGLGTSAGTKALKEASALAARHYFEHTTGPRSEGMAIEGDAADAVNIGLWWLDHHLADLPRLFKSKTSEARARKARKR